VILRALNFSSLEHKQIDQKHAFIFSTRSKYLGSYERCTVHTHTKPSFIKITGSKKALLGRVHSSKVNKSHARAEGASGKIFAFRARCTRLHFLHQVEKLGSYEHYTVYAHTKPNFTKITRSKKLLFWVRPQLKSITKPREREKILAFSCLESKLLHQTLAFVFFTRLKSSGSYERYIVKAQTKTKLRQNHVLKPNYAKITCSKRHFLSVPPD